jgi:hypothetical protein
MNHTPGCTLNVHLYVSDVIGAMTTVEDIKNMRAFVEHIEEWTQYNRICLRVDCFNEILKSFGVYDPKALELKEGSILCGLWVVFLRVYRMTLTDEHSFKYTSYEEFSGFYYNSFDDCDARERKNLYFTAQWIALCCKTMIPARRNKGFYMLVIPKLVEGFHAKYATGTGQSQTTSLRVHLYECEGGVQKARRSMKDGSVNPLLNSSSLMNGRHAAQLAKKLQLMEAI